MFIVIVCYPICDVLNFEVYPSFFIKQFFYNQDKNLYEDTSSEQEQSLKWNKKHYSSFSKDFFEANKTDFFGRWDSEFNFFKWFLL